MRGKLPRELFCDVRLRGCPSHRSGRGNLVGEHRKTTPCGDDRIHARKVTEWGREAPEAGLEPATRSLSEPGAPTSDSATEAKTGAESPPVERPRGEKSVPKPSPKPSPRK